MAGLIQACCVHPRFCRARLSRSAPVDERIIWHRLHQRAPEPPGRTSAKLPHGLHASNRDRIAARLITNGPAIAVMFTLGYERLSNVLLARFTGVYSSQDIADLDIALLGFAAQHGPSHIIRDLSSVDGVAVPASKIVQRGQEPPISPGYRRITVAQR